MNLRHLLLLGVFAGSASVGHAQPDRDLEQVERARFEAQINGDTTALRNLLGDDLVYVHSNALIETKEHFIETVATGRIRYDSLALMTVRHRVFQTTAVGNGRVRVQVQMNGQTVRTELLFTTVFEKRRGHWQLINWQSTRVP